MSVIAQVIKIAEGPLVGRTQMADRHGVNLLNLRRKIELQSMQFLFESL